MSNASGARQESKTKEKKAKQEVAKSESPLQYEWEMGTGEKKGRCSFAVGFSHVGQIS